MEKIINVLSKKDVQKQLCVLYGISQGECTRNGRLNMEIGVHRENDLKAVLKFHLHDSIDCSIDNRASYDLLCDGKSFSIKHVSGIPGNGSIKIKWTSDNEQAQKHIERLLHCQPDDYQHLIISFVNFSFNKIELYFVQKHTFMEFVSTNKQNSFKCRVGKNNRGIELSVEC